MAVKYTSESEVQPASPGVCGELHIKIQAWVQYKSNLFELRLEPGRYGHHKSVADADLEKSMPAGHGVTEPAMTEGVFGTPLQRTQKRH